MSAPFSSTRGIIRASSFPSSACVIPCGEVSALSTESAAMQFESSSNGQSEDRGIANDDAESSAPRHRPTVGPLTNNNVGEVVAKAKKAAASLWMILHAQTCRLPKDKCVNRGCSETRQLLIHVKACPAGSPDFSCPTHCRGCNETRKLLAHYRKCKDIRTKQVGLGRRSLLQSDQGSCLVCSLVARYAKGMMDRTSNSGGGGGGAIQGKNKAVASLISSSFDAKFNVGKGLADSSADRARKTPFERTPSMTLMPPPPPRYGSCPSASTTSSFLSNESFECSHVSSSRPMHSNISTGAAVTTRPFRASDEDCRTRSSDPSLLSKSVDSSISASFPILRRSEERVESADDELIVPGPNITDDASSTPSRRRRSESYDERQTRVVSAPGIIDGSESHLDEREREEGRRVSNNARPRSSSFNSDPTKTAISATSHRFDAIVEEGTLNCEEPMFSID
ncbi:hypothetical protein ACHAXA_011651 [Cyclostephanos tholiformis]|uniref:TAZ-type domain-containing protein n=1 Tax=Cyclostephanos tholiformis TaxID=382380 RepID=A0ABD3SEF6_9STRA